MRELLIASHITKQRLPQGMGLETNSSNIWLNAGWQKIYRHTQRRNSGVVCGQQPPQKGILLPLMHYLVVDDVTEGLEGNGCFIMRVWVNLINGKFTHTVSKLLQVVLSMGQKRCDRNQLSIHPQKFKHQDQQGVKTGS
jgi:hypothetical protein